MDLTVTRLRSLSQRYIAEVSIGDNFYSRES